MNSAWNDILWRQIGASIDMLENALSACLDELWTARLWNEPAERPDLSQFWYLAYHCLFWLDLYLSGACGRFHPDLRHLPWLNSTRPVCCRSEFTLETNCWITWHTAARNVIKVSIP